MPYYQSSNKNYLKMTLEKIKASVYKPVAELKVDLWTTPEPVPWKERFTGEKKSVVVGESWGKLWDCAWMHFSGKVPETAADKKIVLLIDISGEACIFDSEGCPVQGLTTVSSEFDYTLGRPGKKVYEITDIAKGGELIDVWAEAGCNDLFGKYQDSGNLKEACIAECNEEMRQLSYDFEVLQELMENLPENKARTQRLLFALNEVANGMRYYNEEEARQARAVLSSELDRKCGDPSLSVSAIGHAHIDLAWLWPIRETIRKGARTFSTVLKNMEKYPDYVFGASQAQLYQWMKEYYPALYEKMKVRISEGRWEVQGAMWVEADTNITGGEALVRQVLYGKRYFRDEFGKDMKILWLPDVFGYSAALPQILKKSGVDYFMTIKLSWSKYNKHPHHTFWWQGLDGSKVLAHMPPEGTYNSSAAPRAIVRAESEFMDKGLSDRCLLLFGIGDGGGGPGEEHLERLMREKDLNGLVPVQQETALRFFERIEQASSKYKTWNGELYLEYHQGTYTTQARSKRYNRKLELALRELEYAAVQAMVAGGGKYPQEELEQIWKEVLLYQFHDILPGSSIGRVYEESLERYRILLEKVKLLTQEAYLSTFTNSVEPPSERKMCVSNSLSWNRSEWVCVDGRWKYVDIPSMGFVVLDAEQSDKPHQALAAEGDILENDKLRIGFYPDGTIRSIFDKEYAREVLVEGSGANLLAVYEDSGDAWDFPIHYDKKLPQRFLLQSIENRITGPWIIRKSTYTFGDSTLIQEVTLCTGSRRVDFVTSVDWKERGQMLRTSFPVNILANEVTCDIQFGTIKRPVHRNTSWDMAKYEICAHKWVDLSQGDYGVAVLNDCKYGHRVWENIIDINLLRSTGHPDANADAGQHEFTYSLYPHAGDYMKGGVVKAGYELNIPLTVLPLESGSAARKASSSMLSVDAENIIIETVKKAEDNEDIIIRLYECHGSGAFAKLSLNFDWKKIWMVNLMEEPLENGSFDAEKLILKFKPFEILTLRVTL